MNVRKETICTSTVSHSNKKYHKNRKKFYFNSKSCTAMLLAAALLFSSVDGMQARAEELADQVMPVENDGNSADTEGSENISGEPVYVRTPEGAVIISSFRPLEVSRMELEERETWDELAVRMPTTLKAYAKVYVTDESESNEEQPDEEETGDEESGSGENESGEGEVENGFGEGEDESGEDGAEEGEGENGENGSEEGEGENGSEEGEGENGAEEGEGESGENGSNEGESGEGGDQSGESGEGESDGQHDDGEEVYSGADDVAAVKPDRNFADQDVHQWRLLVAVQEEFAEDEAEAGEGEEVDSTEENDGEVDSTEENDGEVDSTEENDGEVDSTEENDGEVDSTEENGGDGDSAEESVESCDSTEGSGDSGYDGSTGADEDQSDADNVTYAEEGLTREEEVEVEVGVLQWKCREDYDNTELTEYTFYPVLDTDAWSYEEDAVPTITVVYPEKVIVADVSTEEELANAFATGVTNITLKNDIALTKSLTLPADANIELDGCGHKLTRGKVAVEEEEGSSTTFLGIMIDITGEDYTRDRYGRLRLKNIIVDGTAPGNRAAASAIVDDGRLTLGEGAQVIANYNYGTIGDETGAGRILEYGGGIYVYPDRYLILDEKSLVTGNYADMYGGGVYLGQGAELWLYDNVIRDNTVNATNGLGPDLFADKDSKIYYNVAAFPDIENWPTFYLCSGVILIPLIEGQEIPEPAAGHKKEIYISVSRNSGYSAKELRELKRALQAMGYTVISNQRTEIDTTDLRNWDVYDHYDSGLWPGGSEDGPSAAWSQAYAEYRKRPYYPCTETNVYSSAATTIEGWLNALQNGQYMGGGQPQLARFKEHIVSREENGKASMTFVGYGQKPYIDFLFYNPQSGGEKVVNFDVDSSMVYTHTLKGNGFLINAGEKDGVISGYLVYYTYQDSYQEGEGTSTVPIARADTLYLYRLNEGLTVNSLHNGQLSVTQIDSVKISSWESKMSIKIKVTPNKVEVWQQPQSDTEIDENTEAFFSHDLEDTGYNGYGPLVAYNSHNCPKASSFTYSNLYMYFTNPEEAQGDMMSPLAEADFTRYDTQRYFINLFGNDNLEYGSENFGQYQGYMQMMQSEGIALITDRDTPFEAYLGSANNPSGEADPQNLLELAGGAPGNKLPINDLVKQIYSYLNGRESTSLREVVEGGGLTPADPGRSVGNIWLKSAAGQEQFRALNWGSFGGDSYAVQIMDDITYYHGNQADLSVAYDILKQGESGYTNICTVNPSVAEGESGVSPNAMGETDDHVVIRPAVFVIEKDQTAWPEGSYAVRQTITEGGEVCDVKGYAYFNLEWPGPDSPISPVDPNLPVNPPEPGAPGEPPKSSGSSGTSGVSGSSGSSESSDSFEPSEPFVEGEYIEETVEMTAGEATVAAAPAAQPEEEPKGKGSHEPKTGDMPIPALPVSLGACTAFMMKLRLWLYELEMGISEEKKNEMLRALISWAKDTSMLKIYLAIAATAIVLTVYHLLKMANTKKKQVVALFEK